MKQLRYKPDQEEMSPAQDLAWRAIEQRFASAAWLAPKSGFSRRWRSMLREQQESSRRTRAAWLTVANAAATLLLFAVLVILVLETFLSQPAALITQVTQSLVEAFTYGLTFLRVVSTTVEAIPLLAVVLFASAFTTLFSLWVLFLSRLVPVQGDL